MANAANKTQELKPRELLGAEAFERAAASSRGPQGTTSGTQRVPSAAEIERFKSEKNERSIETAASADCDPPGGVPPAGRARFVTLHDGRVFITPMLLAMAVLLALVVGFFVGRVL